MVKFEQLISTLMFSILRYSILISIIAFTFIFMFTFYRIYTNVKEITIMATNVIGKEPVPSLIDYYQSIYCVPDDKSRVIWAIGQIADDQALPFLYEIEKKSSCSEYKENEFQPDYEICYETRKAIKWCTTGNATSWMYNNRINWH